MVTFKIQSYSKLKLICALFFFDLQGFYWVKPGPLFRFTGFLQSKTRPSLLTYSDERRATSDERRATSDERRATSDERRATSDERRATSQYLHVSYRFEVNFYILFTWSWLPSLQDLQLFYSIFWDPIKRHFSCKMMITVFSSWFTCYLHIKWKINRACKFITFSSESTCRIETWFFFQKIHSFMLIFFIKTTKFADI